MTEQRIDFFKIELRRLVASYNKLKDFSSTGELQILRKRIKLLSLFVPKEWRKKYYSHNVQERDTVEKILQDVNSGVVLKVYGVDENCILGKDNNPKLTVKINKDSVNLTIDELKESLYLIRTNFSW